MLDPPGARRTELVANGHCSDPWPSTLSPWLHAQDRAAGGHNEIRLLAAAGGRSKLRLLVAAGEEDNRGEEERWPDM